MGGPVIVIIIVIIIRVGSTLITLAPGIHCLLWCARIRPACCSQVVVDEEDAGRLAVSTLFPSSRQLSRTL
jgi:hypothetical protein